VQVGTANLANPRAALDILEGMEKFLTKEDISDINEIIGVAGR
jgi:dihydroorotate dehydrogenase (NAD+) catalytic subunit